MSPLREKETISQRATNNELPCFFKYASVCVCVCSAVSLCSAVSADTQLNRRIMNTVKYFTDTSLLLVLLVKFGDLFLKVLWRVGNEAVLGEIPGRMFRVTVVPELSWNTSRETICACVSM